MIKFKLDKTKETEKGFTLIELLMVIVIIGLLSAVVMASLNNSRQKAQNKAQNEMARQYITAAELFRDENNRYPQAGASDTGFYCLGYSNGGGNCVGTIAGNATLDGEFQQFYPEVPRGDSFFVTNTVNFTGFTYRCINSQCDSIELTWYLNNNNETCPIGSTPANWGNGTQCSIIR